MKACSRCGIAKPLTDFGVDRSRADGRTYWCCACRNERSRSRYTPKVRQRGRRRVAARDDDRKQARRRVNYLVELGDLPNPNAVRCSDCGHIGPGPRHEYDHHQGYAPEHHEDVEAVCAPCHHARESNRSVNHAV